MMQQQKEPNQEALATWSLLMVGTALKAGLTPKQIRFSMRPRNLAASIRICQQGKPPKKINEGKP